MLETRSNAPTSRSHKSVNTTDTSHVTLTQRGATTSYSNSFYLTLLFSYAGLDGSPTLPLLLLPCAPILPAGRAGSTASSLASVNPLTSLSMLELRPLDLAPRGSKTAAVGGGCHGRPGGIVGAEIGGSMSPEDAPQGPPGKCDAAAGLGFHGLWPYGWCASAIMGGASMGMPLTGLT